jgi:DnaK suppressor protein
MDHDHAAELLAKERTRIEEALRAAEGEGPLEGDEHLEPGDRDSEDLYMDELTAARVETLQTEFAALIRAEERLAAGTYGISIDSAAPIPDERLEALPTAERTLDEQQRYERS